VNRWRLQEVREDPDDEPEIYQICRVDDETCDPIMQVWEKEDAIYTITALRWMDSFSDGDVSIPVCIPKPSPAKPARRKKVVKETED